MMRAIQAFQKVLSARRVTARFLDKEAREFPTDDALKQYLHDHPAADKSKHTVKKTEDPKSPKKEEKGKDKADAKEESTSKAPASKPSKSKGLFKPKELDGLGELASQKTKDPDKLFAEAKVAHEQQLDWLNRGKGLDKAISAKVIRADKGDEIDFSKEGPIVLIGPMKKQERAKEKVDNDFGGDWSRLGDAVRASVAVDSFDQLQDVMKKLRKSGLKLARLPKDRFAKPTEAGYRDVLMNVEYPNGHVGELQLHLKPILQAKDAGHKFYEEVRTIEGKAKKEGRTKMTDEEQKIVDEANQKMKDLYNEAWEKATGSPKSKTASLLAIRVAMMGHVAAETKHYDLEGQPAYWTRGKFPFLVTPKGDKVVFSLQNFFSRAVPISASEFEELKKKQKAKGKSKSDKG